MAYGSSAVMAVPRMTSGTWSRQPVRAAGPGDHAAAAGMVPEHGLPPDSPAGRWPEAFAGEGSYSTWAWPGSALPAWASNRDRGRRRLAGIGRLWAAGAFLPAA